MFQIEVQYTSNLNSVTPVYMCNAVANVTDFMQKSN